MQTRDVVIIGSGCAGLTAAIYTARANMNPLVIEGVEAGGQLSLTTLVENFPGFPEGVQGPELIQRMKEQAAKFGTEYLAGDVTAADLSKGPFQLTVSGQDIETRLRSLAGDTRVSVFFTDLPGGSATLAVRRMMREDPDIMLITGANLATLLEFAFLSKDDLVAAARIAAEKGRAALGAYGGK